MRRGSSGGGGSSVPVVGVVGIVLLVLVVVAGVVVGVRHYVSSVDAATANHDAQQRSFVEQVQARQEAKAAAAKAAITLTVQRPEDRPLRVLFAGDSLTVGWGATTEAQSFRGQITNAIEQGGPVRATLASNLSGDLYRAYNLGNFGSNQDLAIVEIGTNDLPRISVDRFRKQYGDMLDRIQATSPDVRYLCLGVWHGPGDGRPFPNEVDFDSAIRDECTARGGKYVDVSDLIKQPNIGPAGRPTWQGTSDNFHPNNDGHAKLAQAILYQLDVVG